MEEMAERSQEPPSVQIHHEQACEPGGEGRCWAVSNQDHVASGAMKTSNSKIIQQKNTGFLDAKTHCHGLCCPNSYVQS